VLPLLNDFARVPVCGLIAWYSATELPPGPDRTPMLLRQTLVRRLTIRGFIVFDFEPGDFLTDVGQWVRDGRLRYREDVRDGLEKRPRRSSACSTARTSASFWSGSPPIRPSERAHGAARRIHR